MNQQITCGQCALRSPEVQQCRLHKLPIKDLEDSCPDGTKHLEICDLCGAEVLPKSIIVDMGLDHKGHLICPTCSKNYYSCKNCGQSLTCDFETSSIGLPKQVQQQIKTEQGYIVTTIMNPERIRQTCEKGCKCFDKEFGCLRQNNYCNNFSIKWRV
jgi:hypothetical protein